jgi:phosphohistidine phosphatase
MKTVLLIRHAKSDWPHGVDDFDRPLNQRGLRDAPEMAKRLLKRKIAIDAFISSTAKRAFTTCTFFAEAFDAKNNIIKVPSLYHAPPEIFAQVIAAADAQYVSIALFSHNPGITEYINELGVARLDNMPTCGIFAVQAHCKHWQEFATAQKEFLFFDYPKAI